MGSVFQRSNIEGKLLNLVTELNQKEELQDGLLKAIVSGEMMSVERKFDDVREIEPFAKHIILTNHLLRISDYSDGLFRRVSIIPLQRQFLGATADPLLIDKLTGELDAITSRALDALGRLIDRNGNFTEPPICTAAKSAWRSDNNHIMQYLAERVYAAPDGSISVQERPVPVQNPIAAWRVASDLYSLFTLHSAKGNFLVDARFSKSYSCAHRGLASGQSGRQAARCGRGL